MAEPKKQSNVASEVNDAIIQNLFQTMMSSITADVGADITKEPALKEYIYKLGNIFRKTARNHPLGIKAAQIFLATMISFGRSLRVDEVLKSFMESKLVLEDQNAGALRTFFEQFAKALTAVKDRVRSANSTKNSEAKNRVAPSPQPAASANGAVASRKPAQRARPQRQKKYKPGELREDERDVMGMAQINEDEEEQMLFVADAVSASVTQALPEELASDLDALQQLTCAVVETEFAGVPEVSVNEDAIHVISHGLEQYLRNTLQTLAHKVDSSPKYDKSSERVSICEQPRDRLAAVLPVLTGSSAPANKPSTGQTEEPPPKAAKRVIESRHVLTFLEQRPEYTKARLFASLRSSPHLHPDVASSVVTARHLLKRRRRSSAHPARHAGATTNGNMSR